MDDKRSIKGLSSLLISFFVLSISAIRVSQASDTLSANQKIRDGESLISANQTFELGFFSPGSSNDRYVGIWYHNLPGQTTVWIANRDRPVLDSSGYLIIDENGDLVILDSIGTLIPITSSAGRSNLTVVVKLRDSGNLVLSELNATKEEQVLWESFDYPTDTLIPGMRMGLHGRENRLITSWTSSDNPAPGDFSCGINPNGTEEFIIWKRGEIYWRSGVWNGHNFSLVPEMTPTYYSNFSYSPVWDGGYYTYHLNDSSVFTRTLIDISGQLKQLAWVESSREWVEFFAEPRKYPCEVPTYCGANGLCNNYTSPSCDCPYGFEPDSYSAWKSGDWSEGCVRRVRLGCGNNDGFFILQRIKLPIFFSILEAPSLRIEDCKAKCVVNCSCTAYASAHENGTGCLFWFGELMGLQGYYDGMPDLFVRLVSSELSQAANHGSKRQLWLIGAVGVPVVMFLLTFLLCYKRIRKLQSQVKTEVSQEILLHGRDNNMSFSYKVNEASFDAEGERVPECTLFSFSRIIAATDNFSASNKLGEGGFGPVYKGMLEGYEIAVKRLSRSSGQGLVEFKTEIALIANLQHRNLVRLLGCCIEGDEKILIYEYMPNKSLDTYIFDPIKKEELDWKKRFHIIEGIAQGLLYLHKYSRLRVIHRDLKASNILLDCEMNPKISDFGMARIFGRHESQANTNRVVGTYGYMSPEYAMEGLFSEKSDVFSFGVLLLEIISGKKNSNFHSHSLNLIGHAWDLWKDERSLELIDPTMGDGFASKEFSRCIHVALLCVQDAATDRPTMSEVASMLSNETMSLPEPRKPVFSVRRTMEEPGLPSSMIEICTVNDITVSALEGR